MVALETGTCSRSEALPITVLYHACKDFAVLIHLAQWAENTLRRWRTIPPLQHIQIITLTLEMSAA